MKLDDIYKSYGLVRERAARVKKVTGLDWEIGGGSQVNLWVTLNDGDTLSEQAQDGIVEDAIKVFNRFTPDEWNAVSAKQGAKDKVEIGASFNQVWCSFPHKIMSRLSVKDFGDLCNTFIQRVSSEIPKWVDKPSESRKSMCSMVKKIESLLNKSEANEPDINKAYQEFSTVLDGYSDATANFLKDCVYIAHSRGENLVNGLRKQGYKLNLAAQLDTDTLLTCYVKDDIGVHKAIDLYFNPRKRVVEVIMLGFDPNYPNAETTKFFSVQKGADAFADFIEGLSDYKGESKMKDSKFKIKVHEATEGGGKQRIEGTHPIDTFISWLYAGELAAKKEIEFYYDDGFQPEIMDRAVKTLLPKLYDMYASSAVTTTDELSEILQDEYHNG